MLKDVDVYLYAYVDADVNAAADVDAYVDSAADVTRLQGVTRKKRTATDLLVLTRLFGT